MTDPTGPGWPASDAELLAESDARISAELDAQATPGRIVSLQDVAEEWLASTGDHNGPDFVIRLVAFAEARAVPIVPGWRNRPSMLAEQADALIAERVQMKHEQQAAEARRIAEAKAQDEVTLQAGGVVVEVFGPTTGRLTRGADGVVRDVKDDALVRNAVR